MPLNLILGPANTRKVGELLDAHARAAAEGRDAWLVVPAAADVLRTQRELAGIAPLPGIAPRAAVPFGQVMAAPGLLRGLLRRTGVAVSLLTDSQRTALARAAIRQVAPEALAPAARSGWLATELVDLAAELTVTGDLERGDPAKALRIWGSRTGDARGRELAELLAADRALRRKAGAAGALAAIDPAVAAVTVVEQLAVGAGDPERLHLVLSGFDDLDPVQLHLVTALTRAGAEVVLSLPFAEGRAALTAARGLVDELRAAGASVTQLEPEPLADDARAARRVERQLYEPVSLARSAPASGDQSDQSLWELRGGGPDEEAVLIAEHVAQSLADGTPPEAIAVVTADPGRDGPALVAALARIGVAAHVAAPTKASRAPSIAAALALLDAAGPEGTAADLAGWLSGPGGPDSDQRLDADVRRQDARDVNDALHLWRRRGHGEVVELRDLRTPAAQRGGRSLPEVLADALRTRSGAVATPDVVGAPAVERDLRAAAHAIAKLDELHSLAERVPVAEPTTADLQHELSRLTVPPESEPLGSVAVVGPLGVRTRAARLVVVARAQRGNFPATESVRRVLAPADRGVLTELGWPRPRRALHDDAERYRAYEVVARATEQLVIAWHDGDGDGNPAEPSPLVEAVARAAGQAPQLRTLLVGEAGWRGLPPARSRRLAEAFEGPRHRERTHDHCGTLAERTHDRYAVGALQKAARCPAMWFVEQELRPEELSPDAAPLTAGRLRHELLFEVISAVRDAKIPLGPAALPALQQALEAAAIRHEPVSEKAKARETLSEVLQRRRVVAEVAATLPALCGSSTLAHQPHLLELSFGIEPRGGDGDDDHAELASTRPVTITRGDVQLPLAGRIDRLDRSPGGELVVVDYKGARVEAYRGAGWVESKELQAGLYALAAEQLSEPGDRAVASLYQPVPGPPEAPARGAASTPLPERFGPGTRDTFDAADWDALLDELVRLAADARDRIDAGVVRADPTGCGGTCRYPWLCRSLTVDDDEE